QIPGRAGPDVQSDHPRLDRLLQPLLQDAAQADAEADRCLCHSMGPSQVQAAGSSDQGRKRLVRPAAPEDAEALCPLVPMSWQRPDIGSRVTREGHARFWERPGVKVPRATRQTSLCRAWACGSTAPKPDQDSWSRRRANL